MGDFEYLGSRRAFSHIGIVPALLGALRGEISIYSEQADEWPLNLHKLLVEMGEVTGHRRRMNKSGEVGPRLGLWPSQVFVELRKGNLKRDKRGRITEASIMQFDRVFITLSRLSVITGLNSRRLASFLRYAGCIPRQRKKGEQPIFRRDEIPNAFWMCSH